MLTNLNSSQKSKIVNRKSQIKFAQVNKMTHSNKLQKKQQRHAKRNPLMAPMGAQINNTYTYHFTNLTNQTFLAGSIQAAPMEIPSEIPAGNGPTGSQAEITAPDNATGNSQEATQQASTKCDKIPAAPIYPSGDLSRISSPQPNLANSKLFNATGNSQEANQQASIQRDEIPADQIQPSGDLSRISSPQPNLANSNSFNATGNSREATQQASIQRDEIPADQIQPSGDLSRISSPQLICANSNSTCNATGNSWEATQQTSKQRDDNPADTQPVQYL